MSTFEEIKKLWDTNQEAVPTPVPYDYQTLEQIIKLRTRKHMKKSMQYFWSAFFLQLLVYALLCHVIIKYGGNLQTLIFALAGVLAYIPFTIVLMKKFKQMAIAKPDGNAGKSLHEYVNRQHMLLKSFYSFKRSYEFALVPLSSAIGVFLTFKLFVPGDAVAHITGMAITFILTLIGMVVAIRAENKKSFEQPLKELRQLLQEFE